MSYPVTADKANIEEWIASKLKPEAIEQQLRSKGLDPENIAAQLKEYKRQLCARKQLNGFIILGAGAFLGFIGCVLALVNPIPDLYNVFLYGITSVAIVLIFAGLYCILE